MEAFGVYSTSYLDTEILILATKISSFKVYDDFLSILKKNDISLGKEYQHYRN